MNQGLCCKPCIVNYQGGDNRPSEFDACTDGQTVTLRGTLRDRLGPVVTFGDRLEIRAGYTVELGELSPDYHPSWPKDTT